MGVVTFNNLSSSSFGIQVERPPVYHYPERDYDKIHIPGRNGDLVFDNDGSFQNVPREYDLAIGDNTTDFTVVASRLMEWLHSTSGYARLTDTYEPDYYRLAMYTEDNEIENLFAKAGRVTVSFDCYPQRFLLSGESVTTFTSNGTITNPTRFKSKPLIRIYGTGQVGIGSDTITILSHPSSITYIDVDCDISDSKFGTTNCNSYVQFTSTDYPRLKPGSNGITLGTGITQVKVTPRWWTI